MSMDPSATANERSVGEASSVTTTATVTGLPNTQVTLSIE